MKVSYRVEHKDPKALKDPKDLKDLQSKID